MKKRMSYFFFVLIFVTAVFAQSKTIVAAADPWPPFTDPDSPTEGLTMEIIRAAFTTQGIDVKMEFVPWARAIEGVKNGTYDLIPNAWYAEEREKDFYYGETFVSNNMKFIKKKGDPFEFDGLSSLDGKKVGTIRGYSYGEEFLQSKSFEREEVTTFESNLKKLIAGRVELVLEDEAVAKAVVKDKFPQHEDKIEYTENALQVKPLHPMTGVKNKDHKAIIDAFNKGLKEIKDNGTYDKIMAKYGM